MYNIYIYGIRYKMYNMNHVIYTVYIYIYTFPSPVTSESSSVFQTFPWLSLLSQRFKNMMIDANSRVTMVDFGLAVQVAPGQELHDSCGTVPFAAPEVGWIGEPEDGVREARKL